MECTQQIQNKNLSMVFTGEFTFTDNPKIRDILNTLEENTINSISIDFSQVTFVDSAGLGMLLILKDEMAKNGGLVTILGATGQVEKMFRMSRFDALFTMR